MSTDEVVNASGRRSRRTRRLVIVLSIMIILIAAVPIRKYLRSLRCRPPAISAIDDPAQLDDLHLELLEVEAESWVRQYRPERSVPGFNLVLYRRRVPLIIDMNGRVVHWWPEVRATGRARLNPDGSLVVIGADNLIKEYTWEGELTWHFQLSDTHDLPHHDLTRLENGNYLLLIHDGHGHADYLLEVDRRRKVVWEWWIEDSRDEFPSWDPDSTDPSHSNSIRELPANRWHDGGDDRFKPGNILVSARTLNTIFIIDRVSGDIVWKYSKDLDGQHEAIMLDREQRGAGLILLFNNGLEDLDRYRRSSVEIIDPVAGEKVWDYRSEYFFSSVGGTAQPLDGGNTLITSSHGGRVFEVTDEGEIVWEWAPPYLPMRVERVPHSHCPQLEVFPSPHGFEVAPEDLRPFVDADLYSFDFRWQTETRNVDGRKKRLLTTTNGCRDILVPAGAELRIEFGLDPERLGARKAGATFRLSIDDHEQPVVDLVKVDLDETSEKLWRRERVSLSDYEFREITMCIETDEAGETSNPPGVVAWANPEIVSASDRELRASRPKRETLQELKLQRQQLKALGYVN